MKNCETDGSVSHFKASKRAKIFVHICNSLQSKVGRAPALFAFEKRVQNISWVQFDVVGLDWGWLDYLAVMGAARKCGISG